MSIETQATIREWQIDTFGAPTNSMRTATRLNEEVAELLVDMSLGNHAKVPDEMADIYVVLCGLAGELGVDIAAEVDKKMTINRARRWRITDEGHGYHIKDGEGA